MSNATERLAPQFSAQLSATLSLRNERLFAVALLLTVAPLWFGRYLPMVDMPQHTAQIVALHEIWTGNPTFTQAFEINWFTPYLLGYLLLYVLALVMPATIATQLVVSLAVVSVPLLTGRLLRTAGADERWKWLAIPCAFGFAFYWGFLSFIVAMPVGLLFLIQSIRFAHSPSVSGGAAIALFGVLLFFCHIIVLGYMSMVALGYVIGSSYRDFKGLVLRMLPFAAPLPLIAVWLLITYTTESVAQTSPTIYGSFIERLLWLLIQPSGRETLFLPINVAVTGAVAVLPFLAGATFSRRPERWLPFVLGLLAFFCAPALVMNTAYFYHRMVIFIVPLWLMTLDAPSGPGRRLDWVAMLVVAGWVLLNAGRFASFARETESFKPILAAMEPGRRVASMVVENMSPLFGTPVYLHFPVWYQVEKRGIVDFNFADFYSQPARYGKNAGPRIVDELGWNPTWFQWAAHGGARYDYFIVKCRFDVSNEIFKEKRGSVQLVARSEWWWLYRNLEGPSAAQTQPKP
ncbi:MAG TPA: hypothetical protein VJT80_18440 [Steroidobacteraceae bacterium]|nr:hypothetical protein [Steroidobacteraceae bacterium]